LVFYDFEKAFDSIEWDFIEATLRAMNFPEYFLECIRLLNRYAFMRVIVNSRLTDPFSVNRGCRQGDPVSPYLFILGMQVLSTYYRAEMRESSLALASSRITLLQYADDTVSTHRTSTSVCKAIGIFRQFERPSGLRLNARKTLILALNGATVSTFAPLECRIETGPVKYLGAWLNCKDDTEEYRLNFDKRVQTYDSLLNRWKLRGLTLIGRNLIVKTLCLSQLTYPLQFLVPPPSLLRSYRKSTERFIWNSLPKVKRVTTTASISDGGLKIIDIDFYIRSLRLAWLGRLVSDTPHYGWRAYFISLLEPFGGQLLLACDFDARFLPADLPTYYRQLLVEWFSLPRRPGPVVTANDVFTSVVWNNKNILIDKKPFYFKSWAEAGVLYIGNLLASDSTGALSFLSLEHFAALYGLTSVLDRFRYMQVLDALPPQWKRTIKSDRFDLQRYDLTIDPAPSFFDYSTFAYVPLQGARSKVFYSLLAKLSYAEPTSNRLWFRDFGTQDVRPYFRLLRRLNLPPYFTTFQWKLLHRLTPTGHYLFRRSLSTSDLCSLCQGSPDTLEHYFFECVYACDIWSRLMVCLKNDCDVSITISLSDALLGSLQYSIPVNVLLLWTRIYIYQSKRRQTQPTFFGLLGHMKSWYNVLLSIARIRGKSEFFQCTWRPLIGLFLTDG